MAPSGLNANCAGVFLHASHERGRKCLRLLGGRPRMQVAARRGKGAVAHRLLDRHDIDAARSQQRAERVPQVVEA
jgi:hypothetical protein